MGVAVYLVVGGLIAAGEGTDTETEIFGQRLRLNDIKICSNKFIKHICAFVIYVWYKFHLFLVIFIENF